MDEQAVETAVQVSDNGSGAWAETWSLLQKQQSEFEKRTAQLEILRRRLEKHLNRNNEPLLRKDRGIAKYGATAGGYRAQLAGQVDDVALEYQESIDTLLQERHILEQRMVELQRQVSKREFAQAESSSVKAPAPSRRIADWRLGIASLLGLVVGGLLIFKAEFTYRIDTVISADPSKVTAEQLKTHQAELARAMPSEILESPTPLKLAGASVITQAGPHTLQISATAEDPTLGISRLQRFAQNYLDRLEAARQQGIADTQRRIQQVESDLVAARQEFDDVLRKRADHRLAIQVENPKAELEGLYDRLREAREQFHSIQARIRDTRSQWQILQRAEIPDFPEVDNASRRKAEEQDDYLRTDLEGLRVRLNQLRRHLLEALVISDDVIRRYAAASEALRTYLETAKLNLDDRKIIAALQDVGAQADKLHQLILDFEKRWQEHGQNLRQMTIDPRRKDCLEIQRKVEDLVKNFNFDTNEVLKDLQLEYQEFSQSMSNPAEHFKLRNGLVNEIKNLVQQQKAFANFASRVLPTSDLQLNDILHSVIGLTRRVRDRRAVLEAELSLANREEMTKELAEKITQQHSKLNRLLKERDQMFAKILSLQDQREALIPYIEEYGATTTVIRYDQKHVDESSARIEQLNQAKARLGDHLVSLEGSANSLGIQKSFASDWPVNTLEQLSSIGFGTIVATALGYLLVWSLARTYQLVIGGARQEQRA